MLHHKKQVVFMNPKRNAILIVKAFKAPIYIYIHIHTYVYICVLVAASSTGFFGQRLCVSAPRLRLPDLAVPEQACNAQGFQVTLPTSSDARSFSQPQFGCI